MHLAVGDRAVGTVPLNAQLTAESLTATTANEDTTTALNALCGEVEEREGSTFIYTYMMSFDKVFDLTAGVNYNFIILYKYRR